MLPMIDVLKASLVPAPTCPHECGVSGLAAFKYKQCLYEKVFFSGVKPGEIKTRHVLEGQTHQTLAFPLGFPQEEGQR